MFDPKAAFQTAVEQVIGDLAQALTACGRTARRRASLPSPDA